MNAIELQDYTKTFSHKTVFKDFNLTVKQGEMVAIMGPSGSGKTTLLNALGLIDPITSGNYRLFEQKAPQSNSKAAIKVIREQISYLFQNFALVDNFTIKANLLMALHYVKKSKAEKNQMIAAALKQVGLPDYEQLKIFEISGGKQQRVAIARTILKPSALILADEPTGALDIKNRDEILSILHSINQMGKTMVVVTHDEEVAASCDRLIRLQASMVPA